MKELRDYLKIFKRYLLLLVILLVGTNGLVLTYFLNQPERFKAKAVMYVNRTPEPRNNQYYTFEGYYAGLASKEQTDVVVGLLKSNDISRLAWEKAALTNSSEKITTEVRKVGPQLINVEVRAQSEEVAKKLLVSLAVVVSERSQQLAKNENQAAEVTLVNPEPEAGPASVNLPLYVAIASVGSLLLTFLITVIREYFRS